VITLYAFQNVSWPKRRLSSTRVGDDGVVALSRCVRLRYLELGYTKVGDVGLSALCASCVHLEHLELGSTKVTDEGATLLSR